MITTCFFDLGNVLVSFSHEKMYQALASVCSTSTQHIKSLSEPLWERYESGALSKEELFCILEHSCQKPLNKNLLIQAASNIFEEKKETTALLQKLKNLSIKLFLISNTCDIHYEYIQSQYQFLNFFDGVILSYQVKMSKPNPAIFQYALEMAQIAHEPHKSLFIDDVPLHVSAAQSLGIQGHLFKNSEQLKEEFAYHGIKL